MNAREEYFRGLLEARLDEHHTWIPDNKFNLERANLELSILVLLVEGENALKEES